MILWAYVSIVCLVAIGTLVKMSEDPRFSEKFVTFPPLKNTCELLAMWARIECLRWRRFKLSLENRILRFKLEYLIFQSRILGFKCDYLIFQSCAFRLGCRHPFLLFCKSFLQNGRQWNVLQNVQYSHSALQAPNASAERPEVDRE